MSKAKQGYYLPTTQSLNAYMKQIKLHSLISAKEERELAFRVYNDDDTEALYKLVVCNLRYVVKVAKSYYAYVPHIDLLDLIQEGNLGLMHAIRKFDPTKGYRLLTYATSWIKAYIQRTITKSISVVKKSVTYSENCTKMFTDVSLDMPIDNKNGLTFMEMLQDNAPDQGEEAIDNEKLGIAEKAMALLSQKERYIIEHRFIATKLKTLNELGNEFGVSREYIRQLEEKAKRNDRQNIYKLILCTRQFATYTSGFFHCSSLHRHCIFYRNT